MTTFAFSIDEVDLLAAHLGGFGAGASYTGSKLIVADPDISGQVSSITADPSWRAALEPAVSRARLTAYAADKRWRVEIGGIVVGGVPIATDDRSKQMIIGARIAADADPNWTTQWVGADGSVHPVDAATVIAISDAVQAHVNACFVIYATVKTDIDAGDITTKQEVDSAGWPSVGGEQPL